MKDSQTNATVRRPGMGSLGTGSLVIGEGQNSVQLVRRVVDGVTLYVQRDFDSKAAEA